MYVLYDCDIKLAFAQIFEEIEETVRFFINWVSDILFSLR